MKSWSRAAPTTSSRQGAAWRLFDTPPARGAWNMALDEALAESIREGGTPTLRFYQWEPACLSLGRNQPAAGRYDVARIQALGFDVVRRPTGGRAVLHRRELTYSVVLPDELLGSAREAYESINRGIIAALRELGVDAELSAGGSGHAPPPSLAPCFREPASGEVVVAGRKLVGSAQLSEAGVTLQHGSLLFDDDQSLLPRLMIEPTVEEDSPAALRQIMGTLPAWETLTSAIRGGLERVLGITLEPTQLHSRLAARAEELSARFSDPDWTWRR